MPYGGSVIIKPGWRSSSRRDTASGLVASPHSTRCSLPQSQRSPARDTGFVRQRRRGIGLLFMVRGRHQVFEFTWVEARQAEIEV